MALLRKWGQPLPPFQPGEPPAVWPRRQGAEVPGGQKAGVSGHAFQDGPAPHPAGDVGDPPGATMPPGNLPVTLGAV